MLLPKYVHRMGYQDYTHVLRHNEVLFRTLGLSRCLFQMLSATDNL